MHGEEGLQAAKRITECLFSGSLSALSEADFEQLAQDGVPMVEMEKGADLMQALVDSELQPSRGQARKTIASMPSPLTVKNSPILNTSLKKKIVCLVVLPYCVAAKRITV